MLGSPWAVCNNNPRTNIVVPSILRRRCQGPSSAWLAPFAVSSKFEFAPRLPSRNCDGQSSGEEHAVARDRDSQVGRGFPSLPIDFSNGKKTYPQHTDTPRRGEDRHVFPRRSKGARRIGKPWGPESCPMMIRLIGAPAQKRCALSRKT